MNRIAGRVLEEHLEVVLLRPACWGWEHYDGQGQLIRTVPQEGMAGWASRLRAATTAIRRHPKLAVIVWP